MSISTAAPVTAPAEQALAVLLAGGRAGRLTHLRRHPARDARPTAWPEFVPPELRQAWAGCGIVAPWEHQRVAAELAWGGTSTALATGTASGKSLAYLMPALSAVLTGETALYLSPTKALAGDQLATVHRLGLAGVAAATCDGDNSPEEREWCRRHGALLLTNPDTLHRSLLPGHARWARFFAGLRFVIVDECHTYRGVFGSHVSAVLRRLSRVAHRYGRDPVFLLASATVAAPEQSATRLVGRPVVAVTADGAPRGERLFALWEPPVTEADERRSATAETAELLADLLAEGLRAIAFVRSRRAAETVALSARRRLAGPADGDPAATVAAYRGGYLPEERRALEAALRDGRVRGLAATSALELGVDVHGLDAVLMAGFPGTRAALMQQAGRAGRGTKSALAVLVARDDPLDTYLVHHPEVLLDQPTEATVLDPDNPQVLYPQLAAAASEAPLHEEELAAFGPAARDVVARLEADRVLRRRPTGWYPTGRRPVVAELRGSGEPSVRLVELATGRLLGTVDAPAAHSSVHEGAVYLHQGETYLVRELDLAAAVALVTRADPDYTTMARERRDLLILDESRRLTGRGARFGFGSVEVTSQVVSYLRRRLADGQPLGEIPLDLPQRRLVTRAVWWTLDPEPLDAAGVVAPALPGSAHAAEHAAIGILPLFATCDRWDVGGLSTALHAQTGRCTVFVYDGYPGGAGFAERAFDSALAWVAATGSAVTACRCRAGCPSCVQSPKCGNGNEPLDKPGALALLGALTAAFR